MYLDKLMLNKTLLHKILNYNFQFFWGINIIFETTCKNENSNYNFVVLKTGGSAAMDSGL